MRPSPSRVRPETAQESPEPGRRPASRPVVERVAGWSARHRKTAVFGWLLLVAVIFVVGQALGTRSVPSYDPGQSGQAERALDQLTGNSSGAATENVLIQARTAGQTFGTDAQMRSAARQVAAALAAAPKSAADIRSPLGPGGHSLVSAGGRSALVTFQVPGNPDHAAQAVQPGSVRRPRSRHATRTWSSRRLVTRASRLPSTARSAATSTGRKRPQCRLP